MSTFQAMEKLKNMHYQLMMGHPPKNIKATEDFWMGVAFAVGLLIEEYDR